MTPGAGWLSATSAGRLLHCPASAAFAAAPKAVPASAPDNAGTLAHFAMSAWLDSRAWLEGEPGRALQAAWDSEAELRKVDAKRLRDSVITRSRLRSRGAELAGLLQAAGQRARSEVFLQDGVQLLYGQLDIMVDVGDGAVIDLKTGADGHNESVRTQLLIYAHLFRQETGFLPSALVAFSLTHGSVYFDCSEVAIDELLARVEDARKYPSVELPDPSGCGFCRRRLRCESHWRAALAWRDPDCVEGVVSKVEVAAAGLTAIRVETSQGDHWVTGLSSSISGAATPGARIRFTEVTSRGEQGSKEWRATSSTRSQILYDA